MNNTNVIESIKACLKMEIANKTIIENDAVIVCLENGINVKITTKKVDWKSPPTKVNKTKI